MDRDFDNLTVISHTHIIRAGGVSHTFGNRILQECIDAGIVTKACKTVTGRTLLTPTDGRLFYQALTSAR